MRKVLVILLLFCITTIVAQPAKYPPTPDKLYGQLFKDVQMDSVFADSKTFVDCTPKRKIADIMYEYGMMKGPGINLEKFVADNFNLPAPVPVINYIQPEKELGRHIINLWGTLQREYKEEKGSSLLPLPRPYMVPGGNLRELHYRDSYFMLPGLKESGQTAVIENMVEDFSFLINNYGYIPKGSRSYYLGRTNEPFFCMMVELLAGIKGTAVYKKYLASMKKEYDWWMDGAAGLRKGTADKRVVMLKDGAILNRYWDDEETPRPENYRFDYEAAEKAALQLAMRIKIASPEKLQEILDNAKKQIWHNLRAASSSGWDISSRWLTTADDIATIETTNIIPVDLNCLLYSLENCIAKAERLSGNARQSRKMLQKAAARKNAILFYCWDKNRAYFFDYNFATASLCNVITTAGLFPLWMKIATPAQATAVAKTVSNVLLKEGGLVCSPVNTGWHWDAPYGTASMQWVAVQALRNYALQQPAKSIAVRWLYLNEKVYAETGKLLQKYNVQHLQNAAVEEGSTTQYTFGSTAALYLALKKIYPLYRR